MNVDIIIPVWNQSQLTVRCLQTIRQHTSDYQLILIDNGSQPEEWKIVSEELARHEYAQVITNPQNKGFVKAVNQGLQASTAPFIVLMNNDTEAVSGWIEKLMEPLKESAIIAMSGPLTTTAESWQGKYPKGKKGWVLRESGMLAFFCTMFKRSLFDEIGLLDERFGIGFGDDDDFCSRTLKAGYKMALVQDLVIPHHHRSTFKKIFAETEIKAMQSRAYDLLREKQSGLTGSSGTNDVVYILGSGSTWGNNEIRYSIRSFKKHFKDIRNVVIVGEMPQFAQNVIYIRHPDTQGVNKDCRMMQKILAACKDGRVSDNFVLCTDDTLLLQDVSFEDFTGWHNGPILYDEQKDSMEHRGEVPEKVSAWFSFVYNTGRELKKRGFPDMNYDRAHCPQPVNKAEFIEVMAEWDMQHNNFTVSNIYNNSTRIFKGQNIDGRNVKIYKPQTPEQLQELVKDKICLNYNDNGLNYALKDWLAAAFPDATPYERQSPGTDKKSAVEKWLANGAKYDEGMAVFAHFAPRNQRLIRWFEMKRGSDIAQKKLRQTLNIWLK